MGAKRVLVASPRGFCAGVCRAVDTVEAALREYTPPIYCFHEIVHNRQVVDSLGDCGGYLPGQELLVLPVRLGLAEAHPRSTVRVRCRYQ